MSKTYTYQSLFFVPLAFAVLQTADRAWHETTDAQRPPKPAHSRAEKAGTLIGSDVGNQGQYVFWKNVGSEVQPVQPQHRGVESKFASVAKGDEGHQDRYTFWKNSGWAIQDIQPNHPRPERIGSFLAGDDGTQNEFAPPATTPTLTAQLDVQLHKRINQSFGTVEYQFLASTLLASGWEPRPTEVKHPRPERVAAIADGDDGNQDDFTQWINYGFTLQEQQPNHPRVERVSCLLLGEDGTDGRFVYWRNTGWELTATQPPHLRVERAGTIQVGDDGTDATYAPVQADGWEAQLTQSLRLHVKPVHRDDDAHVSLYRAFIPHSWEIAPPLTAHPRPERSGSIQPKDDGAYTLYIVWRNDGWEVAPVQPNHPRSERAGSVDTIFNGVDRYNAWRNVGWEIQPYQPQHLKLERSGSVQRGDDGNQTTFQYWNNSGWPVQDVQPNHPRPERVASIAPLVNIEVVYSDWRNIGWEVQAPDWRFERNKLLPVPVNIDASYNNWLNSGWEIQTVQPQHVRLERTGSIAVGDSGTTAEYHFTIVSSVWGHAFDQFWKARPPLLSATSGRSQFASFTLRPMGWEIQPWQPPHRRTERISPIAPISTIEVVYTNWRNNGWEIQTVQPPRLRMLAGLQIGADVIQRALVQPTPAIVESVVSLGRYLRHNVPYNVESIANQYNVWRNSGWDVQAYQPQYLKTERSGSVQLPINVDVRYVNWRNAGWDVQAYQPQHLKAERSAAIQPLVNLDARYQAWRNFGFDIEVVYQRKSYTFAAAVAPKSDGNDARFVYWKNAGWDVQPYQPQHQRPERSSVQNIGDNGIERPIVMGLQVGDYAFGIDGPFVYPRMDWAVAGALMPKSEGIDARFAYWTNSGFDAQSIQPPHRETDATPLLRGDEGNQGRFVDWRNAGWEAPSIQLQYIRRLEHANVFDLGDTGIEAQVRQLVFGFDAPLHWNRIVSRLGPVAEPILPASVYWRNDGWSAILPPPQHQRPERAASIQVGDKGTQGEFTFIPVVFEGFEKRAPQLDHYLRRITLGSVETLTDVYQSWTNAGWEQLALQPQHITKERSGSIFILDDVASVQSIARVFAGFEPTLFEGRYARHSIPISIEFLHRAFAPQGIGACVHLLGEQVLGRTLFGTIIGDHTDLIGQAAEMTLQGELVLETTLTGEMKLRIVLQGHTETCR